jgi:hypothetical protein
LISFCSEKKFAIHAFPLVRSESLLNQDKNCVTVGFIKSLKLAIKSSSNLISSKPALFLNHSK